MNENNDFALVPRPPSALEKADLGAKRVLSGIVADTLALAKKEKTGKSRPRRIVHVNDEPYVLEALGMMIRFCFPEATVLSFTNPIAAFEELSQNSPDLLITDDAMPGMHGSELCQRLLDRKATYPIIVDSPWEPTELWVRELAGRGLKVFFLPAPFDLEDMRKIFEAAGFESSRASAGPGETTPKPSKENPLKIVVMDENPVPVEFMELIIKEWFKNAVLQIYRDRSVWLQELPSLNPNLLILEIVNGDKLDFKTLQSLADRKVTYPIVVTSGLEESRLVVNEYANKGLNITFLPKPWKVESFIEILEANLKITRDAAGKPIKTVVQPRLKRPPRIVVMDDESFVGDAMKMMIEFWWSDATVLTFTDAEEAMQELLREDPDLFTTDWNHTKIPCADMLRLLADRKVTYPILVISASAEWLLEKRISDEFRNQGLDVTLLSKPITADQLHGELLKHFGPGKPSTQSLKTEP